MSRPSPKDVLDLYRGRRVVVTGHTGFKGAWLTDWLVALGAEVWGLALDPDQGPDNLFERAGIADRCHSTIGDIRRFDTALALFHAAQPEIIFHLAAQPLVQRSYRDPIGTIATNVLGTAHVLEAARRTRTVRAFLCVTTDKVYRNNEWAWPYRESDELGGYDPYSASKAAAEMVARSYRTSLAPKDRPYAAATVRGGNVLGGGDWSADRLVPDLVRALRDRVQLTIRNPGAIRPWQHVLDLCYAYMLIGAVLFQGQQSDVEAWNVGPDSDSALSVHELVDLFFASWGAPRPPIEIQASSNFEAQRLALDSSLIRFRLGWCPILDAKSTVRQTSVWYRDYLARPQEAGALMKAQRIAFERRLIEHAP